MEKKSVAEEIRELGNRLAQINPENENEGYGDDNFDLGDHGSELDIDDRGDDGAGFKQKIMYDQLGKVLDSQSNPTPLNTVTTDDGKEMEVNADQARTLRMFSTTDKVKPIVRDRFNKDIQHSRGLADFLDMGDYDRMANLFVKKYLG